MQTTFLCKLRANLLKKVLKISEKKHKCTSYIEKFMVKFILL
jgi:hypothetical protein